MKIGIVGAGKIGSIIARKFHNAGNTISIADSLPSSDHVLLDVTDIQMMDGFARTHDIIVNALPYHLSFPVIDACHKNRTAYFDMTEDRDVWAHIKSLESESLMVPHCGLAPGAVNIIASHLIRQFDEVDSVEMRVGALPIHASNHMKYLRSWSTAGLINEYINDCQIILNGKKIEVPSLSDYETIIIDGQVFEAFHTSGGCASMCDTLIGKVRSLNYKSLRYLGHHKCMSFLKDDLNMANQQELWTDIFDRNVPTTEKDVVIILVNVRGLIDGTHTLKTYSKRIDCNSIMAIQDATASGLCAVVQGYIDGRIPQNGIVRQEDIPWDVFIGNQFGKIYGEHHE